MLTLLALHLFTASPQEALPVVSRLDEARGTRLVLRGVLTKGRVVQLTALARAVQADVTRRFLTDADHSALPPVDLCLFEKTADYDAFVAGLLEGAAAPSELGFFDPRLRVVVANVGLSVGNLRHELAHALLSDDFPDIPSWLTEGVGSLYGTAALTPRSGFRFLVNYRLRHLREARKSGALPDLATLANSTPEQVYGPNVLGYYALSRYLLLYLDTRGTLRSFFEAQRRATSPAERRKALEDAVDERAFFAWSDTLVLR